METWSMHFIIGDKACRVDFSKFYPRQRHEADLIGPHSELRNPSCFVFTILYKSGSVFYVYFVNN